MEESTSVKISVIVPVYRKPEAYLRMGIESVLGQTEADLELILVDDASPDGSGAILREYEARDSRVRVIALPENRGVSAARNAGLAVARGAYLGFLDADDAISPNFYEVLLLAAARRNADMVIAGYRKVPYHFNQIETVPGIDVPAGKGGKLECCSTDRVIWNRIYRRELVGDSCFDETLQVFEDLLWVNLMTLRSHSVVTLAYDGYFYRQGQAAEHPIWNDRGDGLTRYARQQLLSLSRLVDIRDAEAQTSRDRSAIDYLIFRRFLRFFLKIRKSKTTEQREELYGLYRSAFSSEVGTALKYSCFSEKMAKRIFARNAFDSAMTREANLLRVWWEIGNGKHLMIRLLSRFKLKFEKIS